jgi:hypothetical protein
MSVEEPPPPQNAAPPGVARRRLPFESDKIGNKPTPRGAIAVYAAVAALCVGLAGYMAFVQQHPLTSGYVVGPAIGAAWFALRLFMILGPKR